MTEVWIDISGYEGLYQVSNLGRVKSCEKMIFHFRGGLRKLKEKIRKPVTDNYGYIVIDLYKEGKGKLYKVHRLVGVAFIPNEEDKKFINHKNGIKNDNNVNNLEWCTHSENQIHAFKNGLKKPQINGEKAVLMYQKGTGEFVMEFKSISNASKHLNCSNSDICNVLKGRQKSVRNNTFQYKN
jgi:hypothetical protein